MKRKNETIVTLAVGMLIGVIAGILWAPAEGKNTRSLILYRLRKYTNIVRQLLYDLLETQKGTVNKAKEASKDVIRNTKNKAKDLLKNIDELTSNIQDFNYNNQDTL
jgi:gas vesicle protein